MYSNRKLFLSWNAVRNALAEGKVQESDLGVCLFCTSVGELIIAQALYRRSFACTIQHIIQAAKEGRLVYYEKIEKFNGIAVEDINHLLFHNGEQSLDCAAGPLSTVLMMNGVPRIPNSATEVLWADQPTAEQMQEARRLQDQEDLDMVTAGRKPEGSGSNWMFDLRHAITLRG